MTILFLFFLIILFFYSIFGMAYYESYAPPFLAVALICLFIVMKKIWTELQAVHELLEKESNEDEEEEDLGSEITDESEETKEPDETK